MPQARPSKRPKASLEFCQGWVDEHGVWNNGFFCNKWGGPSDKYCCGDTEKYCCPEPASTTPTTTTTKSPATRPPHTTQKDGEEFFSLHRPSKQTADLFPIIVGASVGLVVIVLIVFLILIVCCCCKIKKTKKKNSKTNQPIPANKALSFNMEAEATSAVIAAQALQQQQQQQQQQQALLGNNNKFNSNNSFNNSLNNSLNNYNSSCNNNNNNNFANNNNNSFTPNNFPTNGFTPTPNNENLYNTQQSCNNNHCNNNNCNNSNNNNQQLHCGCGRNAGQHSPTVDLDSLIATMQHNINNSWQQQHPDMDLNPPIGGCPYDQGRPPSDNRIAGFLDSSHPAYELPFNHVIPPSNVDRNGSLSSPMAVSSSELPFKPLPHFNHPLPYPPALPSSSKPPNPLPEDLNRGFNYSPHQMNELRQFKHLIQEYSDKKQRRDSGVLVEEPDIVQNTSSSAGNTSFVPYTPAGSKNSDVKKPLPSPPAHFLDISRR